MAARNSAPRAYPLPPSHVSCQHCGARAVRAGYNTTRKVDPRRAMASKKKKAAKGAAGAVAAGQAVASNPYVTRLIEDEELRDNLRTAFESSKKAYGRMSNGKGPAKALLDDKKTQKELREAASSLKD